ncbi:hypothetical protein QQ008_07780 [Fulvivirgaceae bacterium BMA10]|uniref:Uncharacterized protein n=1 Tax=Splendidivirga corallicola TaxID=3051826 RepID=A0ABT8KKL0_9BACT|nr:hypothetical protein [Fulvivirgaceae bacterium BMA10]
MSTDSINIQKDMFSYDSFAQDLIKDLYETIGYKEETGRDLTVLEQNILSNMQ